MSDQVPPTPSSRERPDAEDPVPNPHRDEPVPAPEEGMRPGADPIVRPSQDEPLGPLAGLVGAASAEVQDEAAEMTGSNDDEAEALLASMGVEEEGIESGQLLGLVAATLVAVAALAVVLIYLFYIPFRTQVGERAEGAAENYEVENLRTEAVAKLAQYTRADDTYGVPIGRAMGLVAAEYGSAGAAGLPDSAAEWNLLPVMRGPGRAVQDVPSETGLLPATATALPDVAPSGERVGQDVDVDGTTILRDNDATAEIEDPDVVDPTTDNE